jgi:hydrogenase maturation protease
VNLPTFNTSHPPRVSVIGLGNVFLGDDGFGPLAVETFRCEYECGSEVEVVDLGTPGMDLAPYLYERSMVIVVDAVHSDAFQGALSVFCEDDFVSDRARLRISGHDPGLWDALTHLRLAGHAPSELIVVGVTPVSSPKESVPPYCESPPTHPRRSPVCSSTGTSHVDSAQPAPSQISGGCLYPKSNVPRRDEASLKDAGCLDHHFINA